MPLSKEMGTANYIIMISENWLTPNLLPFLTFVLAALISFSTGTSWGNICNSYAYAAPLAFAFSGNEVTMILATAAANHIDHVKTQLPYALTAAGFAAILYLVIGFMA